MTIRSSIRIAFFSLLLAGAGSAFATQGTACPNAKVSKQIAKPMVAAQEALKKAKWRDVLARTKEARAVQGGFQRNAFDDFWLQEFDGYAYNALGQSADAAKAWEAVVASPCATSADKMDRYKALAGVYFNLKNYAKAIDYYNKVLASGRDPEVMVLLGQAYFQAGDNKNAQRVMQDVVVATEQRGQTPKEQMLINVLNACERAGDRPCVTKLYEKLVLHYPKQEYWQNLTSSLIRGDFSDEQKINVMRLALKVDVMKDPEQFKEMAQIALDQGLPAEAQAVLDQAVAKNIVKDKRTSDLFDRLRKSVAAAVEADKKAFATKETEAKAAPNGDLYVKLGASYLSYGETAKAVEAIKAGIAKGKLTRPDEAGLLLGIAHLRSNNKDEAKKAFQTVKQDPTMVRTAKLWALNT
jgi:tetratricopeptide (TPR) repeat protein